MEENDFGTFIPLIPWNIHGLSLLKDSLVFCGVNCRTSEYIAGHPHLLQNGRGLVFFIFP